MARKLTEPTGEPVVAHGPTGGSSVTWHYEDRDFQEVYNDKPKGAEKSLRGGPKNVLSVLGGGRSYTQDYEARRQELLQGGS